MLRLSLKFYSLAAAAALLSTAPLIAVETDPVGYVSFSVNDGSDLKVGVPMFEAPVYSAAVDSVTTSTITVPGTVPDVTTAAHYVLVTTDGGSLEGQWYQITGSTSTTITVQEDLEDLGLLASDTIKVYPFWTLNTLFPSGGGLPASDDVFSPVAFVFLNDVSASGTNIAPGSGYFYAEGAQGPDGWYQSGNLAGGLQNDVIISPETYITIRNQSGADVSNIVFSGSVPMHTVANTIISDAAVDQDNQIANPYPVGLTLGSSGLVSDGVVTSTSDVFNPIDLVLLFDNSGTEGTNPAPSAAYFHASGAQGPDGWYQSGNLAGGLQDSVEIPVGGALVIRKKSGTTAEFTWTPPVSYLQE